MAEYEHGKMDINEHEKTFAGFVRFWIYLAILVAAVLILLALLYA